MLITYSLRSIEKYNFIVNVMEVKCSNFLLSIEGRSDIVYIRFHDNIFFKLYREPHIYYFGQKLLNILLYADRDNDDAMTILIYIDPREPDKNIWSKRRLTMTNSIYVNSADNVVLIR